MNIITNFNQTTLLCNQPIKIICDELDFEGEIIVPSLRDLINEKILVEELFQFCAMDLSIVFKGKNAPFQNKWELFLYYEKFDRDLFLLLELGLYVYMRGYKHVDDCYTWNNVPIVPQMFELFCNYIAVSGGYLSFKQMENNIKLTSEIDEFEKRMIEDQKKIDATKNKEKGKETLESIIVSVMYEFHLSIEQLLDMNMNGIYFLYSQCGPIMNYHIGNIAAGNGLLQKNTQHNYWSNTNKK